MFKLVDIIDYSDNFYVVDVEVMGGGSYQYALTSMTKKNKDIEFSFPVLETNDVKEILSVLPNEACVGLVISGRGILYRYVQENEGEDDSVVLNKVLPDANPDDYYLQRYSIGNVQDEEHNAVLSIVRRELTDSIISLFPDYFIVGISIGPFIINNILPLLSIPDKPSVAYHNILMNTNAEGICGYSLRQDSEESEELELSGQVFDSKFLPSLSMGFSFLMGGDCNYPEVGSVSHHVEENRYRQKSIRVVRFFLPVAFALLLLSYLLFDHYYSKVNALESQIAVNEQLIDRLEELKESYDSKSKFLRQSGLLSETRYAYFLDQFAKLVPSSITLDDVTINPQIKKSSLSKEISFERDVMMVSGSSLDSYIFNEWIKNLKDLKDFKEVSIVKYEYKESESMAIFVIRIRL